MAGYLGNAKHAIEGRVNSTIQKEQDEAIYNL